MTYYQWQIIDNSYRDDYYDYLIVLVGNKLYTNKHLCSLDGCQALGDFLKHFPNNEEDLDVIVEELVTD